MNHSYQEYTPPNPDQNYLRTSGSSLQVNMRFKGVREKIISIQHWSTILDPMEVSLKTPQILIGDLQIFIGDPSFLLETPYFHWRPPGFYCRPHALPWRPHIFIGDPHIFIGDPKLFISDPIFSFET